MRRPTVLQRQLERIWAAIDAAPGGAGTQGPKGDKGDQGEPGATGPAGPTGPAGAPGQQGTTGTTGLQGEIGSTGPQGLKGDPGDIGPQGQQGPIGLIGPKGDTGDTGATGAQGPQGPQGAQGVGAAGPTGPTGPAGADSNVAGPQGAIGPQGPIGETGPQGEVGPQGIQGIQGADPWTVILLANDFTTTSGTAVAVTGLAFTPTTNKRYEFEAKLRLRTATTTIGARPGLTWPTGLTDGGVGIWAPNSATAEAIARQPAGTAAVAASTGLPNTTASWPGFISGEFLAGASPSGNVQVTLNAETAGTTVTMKAGSFLRYREVA